MNAHWLLLIPTRFERTFIADSLASIPNANVAICGFGPVIPAARTTQLIHRLRPQRVLLLGIAGAYDASLSVGKAYVFDRVSIHGVGFGGGASFQTAEDMGWLQWPNPDSSKVIGDSIPLAGPKGVANASELLTVCSAAENPADVDQRRRRFPDAVAEDMEGFGVAAACRLSDTPLTIVRGISNQAGDREKQNWKIPLALQSALSLGQQIVQQED